MELKFFRPALFVLLLSIFLAGLAWANYQFAYSNPGGVDFLVHWVGGRALLRGETPYGEKTSDEIRAMIAGPEALPGPDEPRVVYPIYSIILFGPFALLSDFVLARSLWMTFLELTILATALVSLKITAWKPGLIIFSFFIIFSVFWYYSVRAIINGNAVTVVAFLFVSIVWAVQKKLDTLAGLLLALATIKPQLAILPAVYVLLWTISHRRWRLMLSFFGSLAVLTLAGMIIVPTWLAQNLSEITRYAGYKTPATVGAAFESWLPGIGNQIGWVFSIILSGVLIFEWKKSLRSNFNSFLWVFSLTLVASQWIGITTDPGNFMILTLPLVIVLKSVYELPKGRMWVGAVLLVLFFGLWLLFLLTLPPGGQQQSPVMFFPLPLFLLVGLYICRQKYIG